MTGPPLDAFRDGNTWFQLLAYNARRYTHFSTVTTSLYVIHRTPEAGNPTYQIRGI